MMVRIFGGVALTMLWLSGGHGQDQAPEKKKEYVDVHLHLWGDEGGLRGPRMGNPGGEKDYERSAQNLLEKMDARGVRRALLMPPPGVTGHVDKTLFPALRLGYVIVPDALVDTFANARAVVDRHPSAVEQAVLADFITEGHFARHIRRMRALYAERQEVLLELLTTYVGGLLHPERADAGMHLVGWLPDNLDDRRIADRLAARDVVASPLSALTTHAPPRSALLLGFAGSGVEELRRGVEVLARELSREHASEPAGEPSGEQGDDSSRQFAVTTSRR